MRILPVIDLKGGVVVRGVAGRREEYRPVQSMLCSDATPAGVASAFIDTLSLMEIYVADLDAIGGGEPAWENYEEMIRCGARLWIDAGVADVQRAVQVRDFLARHGRRHAVVVASETLADEALLPELVAEIGPRCLVFSLDMKDGRPLVAGERWSKATPEAIAEQAVGHGVRKMIVLDLASVGGGNGPTTHELCERLRRRDAGLEIVSGGGVRGEEDVRKLWRAGCDAVLVASALHRGQLSDPQIPAQGAFPLDDGRVRWRVWAPASREVKLVTWPDGKRQAIEMTPAKSGHFAYEGPGEHGLPYAFQLDNGQVRPDPASRWQPEGVHQPSAVFSPDFPWTDDDWLGVPRDELAIYELHVGTFTAEGTFAAVIPRLPELAELGITAIEIMPVAQFPGERNWGYDGVHLYAAQNSYGGPRELQRLVNAAHRAGVAVILDVVYNHLGPEGNYLAEFGPYFTDAYHTPWGSALNYDGPDSGPVRKFVCENAAAWVRDFHVDGLRLDAVQTIYDLGARHILAELQDAVQREARRAGRPVHVIAETNQNDVRLINPLSRGGYGLDGMWADDFHHAVHALFSGEGGYYSDYGQAAHIAKAFTDVFVFDGCFQPSKRRRHGGPAGDAPREAFVVCVKNHDQVGNRAAGDRPAAYLPPEALRLWCGLLLLHPGAPLIFMGEEYGESRPFPFFCSFGDPRVIDSVRRGRRRDALRRSEKARRLKTPDPQEPATFDSAVLSWTWSKDETQAGLRRMYQELLAARRRLPPLRDRENTAARILPGEALLIIERGHDESLIACANLTPQPVPFPRLERGRRAWVLSSEQKEFGGARTMAASSSTPVPSKLLPYELALFAFQW